MKKIINIFLGIGLIMLSYGCREIETEDVSRITYFPDFEMSGDSYMIVETGSGFTDPGVIATEGGTEITVNVSGSVNPNVPGVYYLGYSATNSDGFDASITRKVRVVTLGADFINIAGTYDGNRVGAGGGPVTITKIATGVYEVQDLCGGYYRDLAGGSGYGPLYQSNAIFTDNGDGTFTASQGFNEGFGLIAQAVGLVYDQGAKKFSYQQYFPQVDFGFPVELTLQEEE